MGMLGSGILPVVKSPREAADEMLAKISDVKGRDSENFRARIVTYIETCFAEAEQWKAQRLSQRILECNRRREGQYSDRAKMAISTLGGCDLYFNKTSEKCNTLEAQMEDVLLAAMGPNNRPWRLSPSPIPSLPADIMDAIVKKIEAEYVPKLNVLDLEQRNLGKDPTEELSAIQKEVAEKAQDLYDDEQKRLFEEATRRVERMETYVADQLVDGDFYKALHGIIQQIATYPLGVIKGPVFEYRKVPSWNDGVLEVKEQAIPTFSCISLDNLFWIPDARSLSDGYVIERRPYNVSTLTGLMKSRGWIGSEIQKAVEDWVAAQRIETDATRAQGDTMIAEYQSRPSQPSKNSTIIFALEFWGTISGNDLLEWADKNGTQLKKHGFKDGVERDKWYPICATKIGTHIVQLRINPDPFGDHPYSSTSYEKKFDSILGRSPVEKMASSQDAYNMQLRAAINNGLMSAGPTTVYDIDLCDPSTSKKMQPFERVAYHGNNGDGSGRPPFHFYQTENHQVQYFQGAEFFSNMAGDDTGIQPIAQAQGASGPASATAYGVGVLQSAQDRMIKRVFGYFDRDIIEPCLRRLIYWNNKFSKVDALKGDAVVVPCGALVALQKDSLQMRRLEYLAATNNPVDNAIIGAAGRAELHRKIVSALDMLPDKVVPPQSVFEERSQQALANQAMQAIPNPQQGGLNMPQEMTPAGPVQDPNMRPDVGAPVPYPGQGAQPNA